MADLRPSNVLLELQGLDGLDEEQVLALLGEPETTDVHIRKDSHPTPEMPHAPKYLVYPVDFRDVSLSVISPRAQVRSIIRHISGTAACRLRHSGQLSSTRGRPR
jgi:hypothetical protein